jgi:hypothetical protein
MYCLDIAPCTDQTVTSMATLILVTAIMVVFIGGILVLGALTRQLFKFGKSYIGRKKDGPENIHRH